jgi:hypothetical protein
MPYACPQSYEQTGQVTAVYREQLVVHTGETGSALVPGLGEGRVGGFGQCMVLRLNHLNF